MIVLCGALPACYRPARTCLVGVWGHENNPATGLICANGRTERGCLFANAEFKLPHHIGIETCEHFQPPQTNTSTWLWVESNAVTVSLCLPLISRYPQANFKGRGIVIVAGGKYMNEAMVTIAAIRSYGCNLRIQVGAHGCHRIQHSVCILPLVPASCSFSTVYTLTVLDTTVSTASMNGCCFRPTRC